MTIERLTHREDDRPCACDGCMELLAEDDGVNWHKVAPRERERLRREVRDDRLPALMHNDHVILQARCHACTPLARFHAVQQTYNAGYVAGLRAAVEGACECAVDERGGVHAEWCVTGQITTEEGYWERAYWRVVPLLMEQLAARPLRDRPEPD